MVLIIYKSSFIRNDFIQRFPRKDWNTTLIVRSLLRAVKKIDGYISMKFLQKYAYLKYFRKISLFHFVSKGIAFLTSNIMRNENLEATFS